jgi:GTP cyclohydrolase III
MMDGSYRGTIIGIGEADTPHDAAENAGANLDARRSQT